MIVVVSGLRLKSRLHWPRFAWHAVRSMRQAQAAEGCLSAEARSISGVQHTLTLWKDGASMKRYARSGAHARAVAIFGRIATGEVAIFEAEAAPDWTAARTRWEREGRPVG